MSPITYAGFIAVIAAWGLAIHRDRGVGVGIRFLFLTNLFMYFIIGPFVYDVTGNAHLANEYPVDPAVQLALAGALCFIVGAYWVAPLLVSEKTLIPPSFVERISRPPELWQIRIAGRTLIGIGMIGLVFVPFANRLPTIGAVAGNVGLFVETGVLLLALSAVHERNLTGLIWAIAVLVLKGTVYALLTGHAGQIFTNTAYMLLVVLFTKGVTVRRLALGLIVGIVCIYPAMLWLSGRAAFRNDVQKKEGLQVRIEAFLDIFFLERASEPIDWVDGFRLRGDFSELLAAAMQHTPAFEPYADGSTYADAVIALVPRVLWPEKPVTVGGSLYVTRYTGIKFGDETSIGTHVIFEQYVNFGVGGVIAGMFLCGLLVARLESCFYATRDHIYSQFWVVTIGWVVCFHADKSSELVLSIFPCLLLCYVVGQHVRGVIRSSTARTLKTGRKSVAT